MSWRQLCKLYIIIADMAQRAFTQVKSFYFRRNFMYSHWSNGVRGKGIDLLSRTSIRDGSVRLCPLGLRWLNAQLSTENLLISHIVSLGRDNRLFWLVCMFNNPIIAKSQLLFLAYMDLCNFNFKFVFCLITTCN